MSFTGRENALKLVNSKTKNIKVSSFQICTFYEAIFPSLAVSFELVFTAACLTFQFGRVDYLSGVPFEARQCEQSPFARRAESGRLAGGWQKASSKRAWD